MVGMLMISSCINSKGLDSKMFDYRYICKIDWKTGEGVWFKSNIPGRLEFHVLYDVFTAEWYVNNKVLLNFKKGSFND